MPALPRYVELVRVSSQGQAARDTPEDQRRALDALRERRPGSLVERIDSAVSGAKSTADRADLTRLFALAAARAFDELRVRAVDRLTRHEDPRERFAIYGAVRDAGAVIVDAGGRVIDPRAELGELDYYFQTLQASRERKSIVERTTAGKKRKAQDGRIAQGRPPFARTYDKRTGVWGTDAAKAAAYRRLFDLCLDGLTVREIAAEMNRGAALAPAGGEWTKTVVAHLLRQRHAVGSYETHGLTFAIPRIVDDATFAAAQAHVAANRSNSGPRGSRPALLRRLLVCGGCGASMHVCTGGHKSTRLYYLCPTKDEACHVCHRAGEVDEAVKEKVSAFLRRPGPLLAAAGREPTDDPAAEIEEATRELADLTKQAERVTRLLRRDLITEDDGETQLREVKRLRSMAEAKKAAAAARADSLERRRGVTKALTAKLAGIRKGLERATFAEWRTVVALLFPRTASTGVVLYPTGRLVLRGTVPLDDAGEAAITSSEPRRPCSRAVPFRVTVG